MSRSSYAEALPRQSRLKTLAKNQTVALTIIAFIAGMILAGGTPAYAAQEDYSEARGQLLDADLIGIDLAEAASSESTLPSLPGRERNQLDVGLLNENVRLDLGGGLQLPLVGENSPGLLQLAQLGTAHSFAHAVNPTRSIASAGTITEDGAIAVDPSQETGDPARVDLTMLFNQLNIDGLTDQIIDEAGLNIGALASRAETNSRGLIRDYAIADLTLNLSSPLVGELTDELGGVVDGLATTLKGALATDGLLGSLVSSLEALNINLGLLGNVGVDTATIGVDGVDAALQEVTENVLQGTVTSDTGLVEVNLDDGVITVDLNYLMENGLNDLEGQPGGTSLLNTDTIQLITNEVTVVLTNVATDLRDTLESTLDELYLAVDLGLDVNILGLSLADGNATIRGSLASFLGLVQDEPEITSDLNLLGIVPIGRVLTPLLNGVVDLVQPVVGTVLGPVVDGLAGTVEGVLEGVLTPLSPVVNGLLSQLVQISLNDQGTREVAGHEAHYVTALSLTLLPQAQAANLDLATSTVRALDEYADVVIASPEDGEVILGDEVEVTGTAQPGVEVTVELDDKMATVTANSEGSWSVTFNGVSSGGQTATATDDITSDAVDFVVRFPVEITSPSVGDEVPGGLVPVTGTSEPDADLTVTLCLEEADCPNEEAPTQSTQADAEGNWSVEFESVPPGEHTITAADEFDADEVTFHVVYSPVIQLGPDTVVPGTPTTVTGEGFAAREEVTITLPDGEVDGDVVSGAEVTTTSNGNGEISVLLDVAPPLPSRGS